MKQTLLACLLALGAAGCAMEHEPEAAQASAPPPAPAASDAAAPASQPLAATGRWDVAAAKCSALLAASDDDRAAAGMFYYGYLAAKYNYSVIETGRIESDLRAVFATCHDHPDMTIVTAFRTSLAKKAR